MPAATRIPFENFAIINQSIEFISKQNVNKVSKVISCIDEADISTFHKRQF